MGKRTVFEEEGTWQGFNPDAEEDFDPNELVDRVAFAIGEKLGLQAVTAGGAIAGGRTLNLRKGTDHKIAHAILIVTLAEEDAPKDVIIKQQELGEMLAQAAKGINDIINEMTEREAEGALGKMGRAWEDMKFND